MKLLFGDNLALLSVSLYVVGSDKGISYTSLIALPYLSLFACQSKAVNGMCLGALSIECAPIYRLAHIVGYS